MRALAAGLVAALVWAQSSYAQENEAQENEVAVEANKVIYDDARGLTILEGDAQASRDGYVLRADRLTHDSVRNQARAQGAISLTAPQGATLEADAGVFDLNLATGTLTRPRVRFAQGGRLEGSKGARQADGLLTLDNAYYTACPLCMWGKPLWAARARRAEHDPEAQELRFEHPRFEVLGLPVGWLPSLTHPDPTAKRAAGWLVPQVRDHSRLGASLATPLFLTLGDHADLTINPTLYFDRGLLAQARLRVATPQGGYNLAAAVIAPQRKEGDAQAPHLRGAVFGEGRFAPHEDVRVRFRIQAPSDRAFAQEYELTDAGVFINDLEARWDAPGGTLTLTAREFRDRRLTAEGDSPDLLPSLDWSGAKQGGAIGGRWQSRVNAARIRREGKGSITRLRGDLGWERAFNLNGLVARPFGSLQTALYRVHDSGSVWRGRALPTLGLDLTAPLVRHFAAGAFQTLELRTQLIYAAHSEQSNTPNEDSRAIEFDDTNLFYRNRFSGLDRWEDGSRANLGATLTHHFPGGGAASARLGQTFRFEENDAFTGTSGLRPASSDLVGAINIHAPSALSFHAKARATPGDLKLSLGEVESRLNLNWIDANAIYAWTRRDPATGVPAEQLRAALRLGTDTAILRVEGGITYDLTRGKALEARLGLRALHPCLTLAFAIDRSIGPNDETDDSVSLRITLRNPNAQSFRQTLFVVDPQQEAL